jgi:hypothetical protein
MSRDDGLQLWPVSPLEAVVVVHVAERTDQAQVHDRELAGGEAFGGGILLEPVQASIENLTPRRSQNLAVESNCRFVTADERFPRKVGEGRRIRFRDRIIPLAEGAGGPDEPTPKERRSRSSESGE